MIPGAVASANDGFDEIIGWDTKADSGTHWLYIWSSGTDKTLTVVRGLRAPVEIAVIGGGAGGNGDGDGAGGGGAGGVFHSTSWTFYKKETWSITRVGTGGGMSSPGLKTRIQNAANTAYIEAGGGGIASNVSNLGGASGSVAWVTEEGLPGTLSSYSPGGVGGSGSRGSSPAGLNGGPGLLVSWWVGVALGGGGGAGWSPSGGTGWNSPSGGGNGAGPNQNATSANGFAAGSAGGGVITKPGYVGGSGAPGAIFVRIPKVLQ